MVTFNMLTATREPRTEPYKESHALQSNNGLYLRRSKTGLGAGSHVPFIHANITRKLGQKTSPETELIAMLCSWVPICSSLCDSEGRIAGIAVTEAEGLLLC